MRLIRSRCTPSSYSRRTCCGTRTRTRSSTRGGSTCSPSRRRPDVAEGRVPTHLRVLAPRRSAQAIAALARLVHEGRRHVVLRGVTGSGKTYTIANVIAGAGRPTLVISPNKTLAAQLFAEFKPSSQTTRSSTSSPYYDYYQPEAYIPQSDTYIEKDALINDEIDRMRHSATKSLLERAMWSSSPRSRASTASAPLTLRGAAPRAAHGEQIDRDEIIRRLIAVQYERNDYDFHRGTFRCGATSWRSSRPTRSRWPPRRAVRRRRWRRSPGSKSAEGSVLERGGRGPTSTPRPHVTEAAARAARSRRSRRSSRSGSPSSSRRTGSSRRRRSSSALSRHGMLRELGLLSRDRNTRAT